MSQANYLSKSYTFQPLRHVKTPDFQDSLEIKQMFEKLKLNCEKLKLNFEKQAKLRLTITSRVKILKRSTFSIDVLLLCTPHHLVQAHIQIN